MFPEGIVESGLAGIGYLAKQGLNKARILNTALGEAGKVQLGPKILEDIPTKQKINVGINGNQVESIVPQDPIQQIISALKGAQSIRGATGSSVYC